MERNGRGHRLIGSATNPQIKRARSLRDKKHRRREGLFLAEGLRILTEALDEGILPEQMFYAGDRPPHPLAEELADRMMADGRDVVATSADILGKLSGKDNPQSVVGLYRDRLTPLADIDRSDAPIWLVAQAMRDPGNLGTLLRTGDAVGAGGVILIDDCVDPFAVETVRASMGAIFTQAIAHAAWEEFAAWLRAGPGQLAALTLSDDSVDYRAADYPAPTFILVGNEARGLPAGYAAAADVRVKLPMLGRADSLNAAVSAAVLAYHVLDRQRQS